MKSTKCFSPLLTAEVILLNEAEGLIEDLNV